MPQPRRRSSCLCTNPSSCLPQAATAEGPQLALRTENENGHGLFQRLAFPGAPCILDRPAGSPAMPLSSQPDLIIRDALLIDGSGQPGRRGDLAVTDDHIVAMGDLAQSKA